MLIKVFVSIFLLYTSPALSFQSIKAPSIHQTASTSSKTTPVTNDLLVAPLYYQNDTRTLLPSVLEKAPSYIPTAPTNIDNERNDEIIIIEKRNALKKELARVAIEHYDLETAKAGVAEEIMKRLEPLCPWERPATHPDLNARWSFVFTGVPTIGMKLITLLSRISVGVPPVDFCDVFLEVSNRQSAVQATVFFKIFGLPLRLNILTNLRLKRENNPRGTFLIETFQKILLSGVELPTPESWRSSRDLEITYLDADMMIARTAGGEPHFLLRHSPCSTDDVECVIDDEENVTAYFQEARAKYGSDKLTRSLVDRAYGDLEHDDTTTMADIAKLVQSIFDRDNKHG